MNETLYPELIDYIYEYCSEFKTNDEKIAGRTIIYTAKTNNEKMFRIMKSRGWYSDEQHILDMLADGNQVFITRVATRIFNDHKDKLDLNLCPQCGKIARTPKARQCRFCGHTWH